MGVCRTKDKRKTCIFSFTSLFAIWRVEYRRQLVQISLESIVKFWRVLRASWRHAEISYGRNIYNTEVNKCNKSELFASPGSQHTSKWKPSENVLTSLPYRNQRVGKKLWICFWVYRECVHATPWNKVRNG